MEELPSKTRNQVRKSLKTYEFKQVPYQIMLNEGFELFNKSRERFRDGEMITIQQWSKRLKVDQSHDFWLGYDIETGKPASFAINTLYEQYCDYSSMGFSPEFPNNTYPLYGLIYEMNRYYLEEKGVPFVCDGARSLTEHSNIQPFLEEKFKFRKAYCDLQVIYKPIIGFVVKSLFPFRRLIKEPRIKALLYLESMSRGIV